MTKKSVPEPGDLSENPMLSVCMIVRDEEKVLPRCLRSVQTVADELIVVDTGSRDNTISIAEDFGAKVFRFEWCDDFAAARNESLKYATGDWIFQVDADDELVSDSVSPLEKAIRNPWCLISLVRQDDGVEASRRFSWIARLFRNHPSLRYSRPYHETVDESAMLILDEEPRWKILHEPSIILRHEGYRTARIANKVDRGKKSIAIMEAYLKENPNDKYILTKLGTIYCSQERYAKAEAYLNRAMALGPRWSETSYWLGVTLFKQKKVEAAMRCFKEAVAADPFLPEAHTKLGAIYFEKKMYNKAVDELKIALSINPESANIRIGLAEAHAALGAVYLKRGMTDEALSETRKALEINSELPMGLVNLGLAYISKGLYDEAIVELKKALAVSPGLASAHLNLGMAYAKKGMFDEAFTEFDEALNLDPAYPEVHYNLALLHYKRGNHEMAIRHCDQAMELGINAHPQLLEWLEPYRN
jgi:tetratricopeptide (TPR) repeat protein